MYFKILGDIQDPETIARGTKVRARRRLRKVYGHGRWRKCKGCARVELASGEVRNAEIHGYEASGIGKKEFKVEPSGEARDAVRRAS